MMKISGVCTTKQPQRSQTCVVCFVLTAVHQNAETCTLNQFARYNIIAEPQSDENDEEIPQFVDKSTSD